MVQSLEIVAALFAARKVRAHHGTLEPGKLTSCGRPASENRRRDVLGACTGIVLERWRELAKDPPAILTRLPVLDEPALLVHGQEPGHESRYPVLEPRV
jgi:hypothetical protein